MLGHVVDMMCILEEQAGDMVLVSTKVTHSMSHKVTCKVTDKMTRSVNGEFFKLPYMSL